MATILAVLNGGGDTRYEWDAKDPARCAEMRAIVAELKLLGYLFFLVDGTPADEVSAGTGALLVRKAVDADEVVATMPAGTGPNDSSPPEGEAPADPPPDRPQPRRRGRPPKAQPAAPDVVAVRPIRGG